MKKLILLIIVIFASLNLTVAQILPELEKIKEIKLLESNRDDVRRIFAGYKLENDERRKYEDKFKTKDFEIEVSYSVGNCSEELEPSFAWEVPEWKVTSIEITPESPIKFNNAESYLLMFGTKLSKYKKEKMYDNDPDLYLYHNKELGISFEVENDEINYFSLIPSTKYYSLMCDKEISKILSKTKSAFYKSLKKRRVINDYNTVPDVVSLILSVPEILADCSLSDSKQYKTSSQGIKEIAVFAVGKDMEGDVLAYEYKVSAGKIIGQGSKVVWDLSGVKPGTYTITAAVDDGCGFCGKTMTKTVVVKECPNCKQN